VLIREVLRRLEGGPIRSHSLSPLNTQHSVALSVSFSQSLLSLYPLPPLPVFFPSYSLVLSVSLFLSLRPFFSLYILAIFPISLPFSFYLSSISVSLSLSLLFVSTYFSFSQYLSTVIYLSLSRFMGGSCCLLLVYREKKLLNLSLNLHLSSSFSFPSLSLSITCLYFSLLRDALFCPSLSFLFFSSPLLYISPSYTLSLYRPSALSLPPYLCPHTTISVYCDPSVSL